MKHHLLAVALVCCGVIGMDPAYAGSATPNMLALGSNVLAWKEPHSSWMQTRRLRALDGNLVSVRVVSDQRGPLDIYEHDDDYYVAGNQGERYALLVRNNTSERLLVVMSVDGTNVITGQVANLNQSGYILQPWQTLNVSGWRKNYSEVARFYFVNRAYSYAHRMGQGGNEGVIGLAVFREQKTPAQVWWERERARQEQERDDRRYDNNQAERPSAKQAQEAVAGALADALSKAAPAAAPSLGTGHGERERSEAREGRFVRDSDRPAELLELSYDQWDNLVRKGVVPKRGWMSDRDRPDPFPGDNGFAPDPR